MIDKEEKKIMEMIQFGHYIADIGGLASFGKLYSIRLKQGIQQGGQPTDNTKRIFTASQQLYSIIRVSEGP